jgi:hypothetical protein
VMSAASGDDDQIKSCPLHFQILVEWELLICLANPWMTESIHFLQVSAPWNSLTSS